MWQAGFPGFACEGEFFGVVLLSELAARITIAFAGTLQIHREAAALTEQARTRAELADAFKRRLELLDITGELSGQLRLNCPWRAQMSPSCCAGE